jgi:hypothetical protein
MPREFLPIISIMFLYEFAIPENESSFVSKVSNFPITSSKTVETDSYMESLYPKILD